MILLCDYGYDSERGHTCYTVIKCECGEKEVIRVDDKLICKKCKKERKKKITLE